VSLKWWAENEPSATIPFRTLLQAKERWRELCAQAITEQDSVRLLALIDEIVLLRDKQERIRAADRMTLSRCEPSNEIRNPANPNSGKAI
jgi:hypothetical protein